MPEPKVNVPMALESTDLFQAPAAYRDVDLVVNKVYLQNLERCEIAKLDEETSDIAETACFFPIKRVVLDRSEDILQKLASVYASAGSVGANPAMIIRGYSSGEVEMYLGVCDEHSRINGAYPKARVLYDSFIGNFPGCRDETTRLLGTEDTRVLLNKCYDPEYTAVAAVSSIASLRNRNDGHNVGFYQGLDKLIETMSGTDYSMVILARPLDTLELENVRSELEDLYSRLSPYARVVMGANWSEAQSLARALSNNLAINVTNTQSVSLSVGKNRSSSVNESAFSGRHYGINIGGGGIGGSFGGSSGEGIAFGQAQSDSLTKALSKISSEGKTVSNGQTDTASKTLTVGESVQMTVENKTVLETLHRIDEQLSRIRTGKSIGMFATAAYFLAPSVTQTHIAASTYKAIVSGSATNLESAAINLWSDMDFKKIVGWLRRFRHPIFNLNAPKKGSGEKLVSTTPAVLATSDELAISMGLPRNKVNGIPVSESVGFERNVVRLTPTAAPSDLRLGNVYHLDREEKTAVALNIEDLTMHCFIAGTTGSGKSNTVYGLLEKILALKKDVHFMVIEPVKGDYKTVFGHRADVSVYGTNGDVSKLLRINPFRFRCGVHVLEHIDYLIGIFKVCWSMEAAMPSVLKRALERAYRQAGWDLGTSKNIYSQELFPSFRDVLEAINRIMDESDFSAEVKGNYKGALCTRLEDMTTGLNEKIFVSDDLSDSQLFEENVIVDLSRLGSDETRSLLMGLLVIRLKEFRQSTRKRITENLRHVTVLEEAHNLLKRTSTEQTYGIANMTGKAVEMLSGALADMRSAGEAFIIVDQSPSAVDAAAIRNTNTKIVLRLPETIDREMLGRAISLDQLQIGELAKLPTGVAAVYQNNWMGAALVKMPYFPVTEEIFCNSEPESANEIDELSRFLARDNLDGWIEMHRADLENEINRLQLSGRAKFLLSEYAAQAVEERPKMPTEIAFSIFNAEETIKKTLNITDVERLKKFFVAELSPSVKNFSREDLEFLMLMLITEQRNRDGKFAPLFNTFMDYLRKTDGLERIRMSRTEG